MMATLAVMDGMAMDGDGRRWMVMDSTTATRHQGMA